MLIIDLAADCIPFYSKSYVGLRVGVDVAWSNEDFAWGISLGTGL